jgi:hypothetical protein
MTLLAHLLPIHTDLSRGSVSLTILLDMLDKLRHAEQVVHLLERQALGLGDEEPDEEEHGEAEARVDEEGATQ